MSDRIRKKVSAVDSNAVPATRVALATHVASRLVNHDLSCWVITLLWNPKNVKTIKISLLGTVVIGSQGLFRFVCLFVCSGNYGFGTALTYFSFATADPNCQMK